MATVSIERENGRVVFRPNPINIGITDVVVFVNNDTQASHQITKVGLAKDAWMKYPLGPAVAGQDPFTSPGIAFGSASSTIDYRCAVDGHTETGSIVIKVTA